MLLPAPLSALLGLAALVSVGFWFKVAITASNGSERELRLNLSLAATSLAVFLGIVAFGFIASAAAEFIW